MDSMLSLLSLSNHIYVNSCILDVSAVTWVYKYKLLSPAAQNVFRFLVPTKLSTFINVWLDSQSSSDQIISQ